jgi:putative ATP-dependent endonuclease of the OLD family
MAELARLSIRNFRSISNVAINFPPQMPVVLFGQNNAGKSNILRALNIILGEQYPKSITLEDSDYFQRDHNYAVRITAEFRAPLANTYSRLSWIHQRDAEPEPTTFVGMNLYGTEKWPRNEEREDCIAVVIEANRNLSYQLSYTSKYTLLSRVMHRFHAHLHNYESVKDALIENFQRTKEIFEQVPEFQRFAESLRYDFSSALRCWSYKLDMDFEAYNPLNFFHALRVQAKEGQETRAFEELGTGEQQILALCFAHAYAKAFKSGFVLAIEEPEAHLHPLAQNWLAERIKAMCSDGVQIVLTTHSPSFLNLLCLSGMHLVYKDENITKVQCHNSKTLADYCCANGADPNKCDENSVLPFYAANSSDEILKGFFARAVVIVEGPTEALALPIYLSASGLDSAEKGIAIVPVYGKGNMPRYIRLFEAFGIPTYCIFDNDPADDSESNKRKEIIRTCGHEFDKSLLAENTLTITDRYTVFGRDFEQSLREQFSPLKYEEKERVVKELYGPAKPLVAREVAVLLVKEKTDHECWEPIKLIASMIAARLGDQPTN